MSFDKFNIIPEKKIGKTSWSHLQGAGLSLALANLCEQTSGVRVIVAPDSFKANVILDELNFFLNKNILMFPDWETLPYDSFSPHQDIISERLAVLNALTHQKDLIIVIAASTLMHQIPPLEFLTEHVFLLKEGQKLDLHTFRDHLLHAGYRSVNQVFEHGEFAVRGGLIDVYPMGSSLPYRVEQFDDCIESIRIFDPETQRTIEKISSIHLLPARECPMNEKSVAHFRQAFRTRFSGNPSLSAIYESVSEHQFPQGIEYYLPLFFEKTATFFDYLPQETHLYLADNILEQAEQFWEEASIRYEQRSSDITRPILTPQECFLNPTALLTLANQYEPLHLYTDEGPKKSTSYTFPIEKGPLLPIDRSSETPLHRLKTYLDEHDNYQFLIVVESTGRREVLLDLLKKSAIHPTLSNTWQDFVANSAPIQLIVGSLQEGLLCPDQQWMIIVESQLYGEQRTPQRRRDQQKSIDPDLIIRDLAELSIGSPVVHLQFGVGRYQGLQTFDNQGVQNEFLILTYAGNDKIYVPVTSLHCISRYTGSENAPLHRLGSDEWQKEKKKAAEKIHDVAIELLDIYAKRAAKPGHRYHLDIADYQRFANAFLFDETVDQQQAIQQILSDMQSDKPMDRLICGDVGFGKTEVAMRAAFLAVQNGKQVCVLVPTTLLAGQHFETFRDRFSEFAVNIELLSRFRSAKESTKVIESLKSGQTDIVIGTHKLFQKTIQFKDLGLLIIDEEHRFGVKQKEHINTLRTDIDVLSMTATPIPRTLNMAMAGIRDISLIATPPAKRLAIKTFWQEKRDHIVREAILREILRGGQVFYLHNNVETIANAAQTLENLMPEAKIQFAHGQMKERDLERIMSDFYHHRFNVLVCTTIIETGIDIPTANTIIIDGAHHFGLAQLHQLRGRVGRSHHQAYAYLLTPAQKHLTSDAKKRLEAIMSLEDLGAGFTLATHDLEIRGAGELLGAEQSGNMHAIGFNLFMEMLDKAVEDLKAGKTPELNAPLQQGPDIDLRLSSIIPETYISDVHTRLIFYKRIANAADPEALRELQIELIDRFGLLPQSVKHLFLVTALKFTAKLVNVLRIQGLNEQVKIEFEPNANIDPAILIHLIQVHAKRYQLDGPTKLKATLEGKNSEERIMEIQRLLMKLKRN